MSTLSAFKTLYTQMIENGGDYDALPKDILKKDLQVFVKETRPYFLVSDSFFYVPAYFTQAALNDYNSKFPSMNILDLDGKVIVIHKWSLELRKVNSQEVFTSYAGLECRLIVHAFKPQLKESLHPTRHPTNLYRDDEFKTTIQSLRHRQISSASAKSTGMAPLTGGKGQVSQGVVANACGDWKIKEGNTKTASLGGAKKRSDAAASKVPKVRGGSKGKAVKKTKGAKSSSVVDSVVKAVRTPTGKTSKAGKKSLGKAKPTPDEGKKSKPTSTGVMTVAQYRKFLNAIKKGGKKAGKK